MVDHQQPAAGDRVVIVGGGAAGATAARTLRRGGWEGEVVLLTREPHEPYDRTMLSKGALLGDVDEPRPLLADRGGPDDDPDATTVEVRCDTPVERLDLADRRVVTAAGESLDYDHLVLAPGARSRRLDLPGADLDFVHTLRERASWAPLRDAVQSGGRLAVIGGGLIGLEVAAAAAAHGGGVTVIEVADRLMGRLLPPAVARIVADAHESHGVRLVMGRRPVAVEGGSPATRGLRLDDDTLVEADAVLVSVGSVPNLSLARRAGLVVDDGILVDDHLRTSAPHVWAIGDAVRVAGPAGVHAPRTESWTPATAMGQRLARTLLGSPGPYREAPWMWSDQYDLRLQAVGGAVPGTTQVTRGDIDGPQGLVVFAIDDRGLHGAVGVSRGAGVGRTIRAAQLLIDRDVAVTPDELTDQEVDLRGLLRR